MPNDFLGRAGRRSDRCHRPLAGYEDDVERWRRDPQRRRPGAPHRHAHGL